MPRTHVPFIIALALFPAAHLARGQCGNVTRPTVHGNSTVTNFGYGRALAASGNRFVTGRGNQQGGVEVFERCGAGWSYVASLSNLDGAPTDNFGVSVAIRGERVIAGSSNDDDSPFANSGSARIFDWNGLAWVGSPRLVASNPSNDAHFGESVALSTNYAFVGAPDADDLGADSGAVYVFVSPTWFQYSILHANDAAPSDAFGEAVAADGDYAVVGVRSADAPGMDSGAAYVFKFNGAFWVQQQKLTAFDGAAGDRFGTAVAIFGDTILVGAPGDDDDGESTGAGYLFRRTGSTWTFDTKFVPDPARAGHEVGSSVALTETRVLLGAPGYFDADQKGAVFGYENTVTNGWEGAFVLQPTGIVNGDRCYRVAAAGDEVLIGNPNSDEVSTNNGAIYAYTLRLTPHFVLHPSDTTASAGQPSVALFAFATGIINPSYRWYKDGVELENGPTENGSVLSGVDSVTLTISTPSSADAGTYQCYASICFPFPSNTATLTIVPGVGGCPGDADGNGAVNFADITKVLTFFGLPCQ